MEKFSECYPLSKNSVQPTTLPDLFYGIPMKLFDNVD